MSPVAQVKHRVRGVAERGLARAARAAGYELVTTDFYSPLPDIERLPRSGWDRPRPPVGVDLRVEAARAFLADELGPYLREFRPPLDRPSTGGFYVRNGSYESVDAESLYAIVRLVRPSRLIELGSGASSHVIAAAAAAGAADGHRFEHVIVDPHPFTASPLGAVAGAVLRPERVEDVDVEELTAELTAGDVLFVDTTHTVKTGGDVTRIVLELFPRLAPGVWVHLHDVFLPYEYPREWVVEDRRAWAEQYLLQAFLAFNETFEVMLPAHAVTRAAPDLITELVPSYAPGVQPGAFWMRRTGRE